MLEKMQLSHWKQIKELFKLIFNEKKISTKCRFFSESYVNMKHPIIILKVFIVKKNKFNNFFLKLQ